MSDAEVFHREAGRLGEWLTGCLADLLGCAVWELDVTRTFEENGLHALGAVALAAEAERACGTVLEPTAAWDHPTVGSLARHLAAERRRARLALDGVPGAPSALGAAGEPW
ncbi:Phosphopantetheine attachment site [Streptomyces misionensis]|uniref:Phosphopantetheine attachment site n=1 Tax=Streptomyces misionensis TaxID=67331 RepID=A0A1H4IBR2_9ACTN|nr:acyl carrier protein [Streptomyces misionensis]SEB31156.1 Phosphopantetheine attachment site [Streptomyces misionensis]